MSPIIPLYSKCLFRGGVRWLVQWVDFPSPTSYSRSFYYWLTGDRNFNPTCPCTHHRDFDPAVRERGCALALDP